MSFALRSGLMAQCKLAMSSSARSGPALVAFGTLSHRLPKRSISSSPYQHNSLLHTQQRRFSAQPTNTSNGSFQHYSKPIDQTFESNSAQTSFRRIFRSPSVSPPKVSSKTSSTSSGHVTATYRPGNTFSSVSGAPYSNTPPEADISSQYFNQGAHLVTPETFPERPSRYRRFIRPGGFVALFAIACATCYDKYQEYQHDMGLQRSAYFWKKCLPIYLHYERIIFELEFRAKCTSYMINFLQGGTGWHAPIGDTPEYQMLLSRLKHEKTKMLRVERNRQRAVLNSAQKQAQHAINTEDSNDASIIALLHANEEDDSDIALDEAHDDFLERDRMKTMLADVHPIVAHIIETWTPRTPLPAELYGLWDRDHLPTPNLENLACHAALMLDFNAVLWQAISNIGDLDLIDKFQHLNPQARVTPSKTSIPLTQPSSPSLSSSSSSSSSSFSDSPPVDPLQFPLFSSPRINLIEQRFEALTDTVMQPADAMFSWLLATVPRLYRHASQRGWLSGSIELNPPLDYNADYIADIKDHTQQLLNHVTSFSNVWYFIQKVTHQVHLQLQSFNPVPTQGPLREKVDQAKFEIQQRVDALERILLGHAASHLIDKTLPVESQNRSIHRDAQFTTLNEQYATDVYNIITHLKGYFIKLGQLGSLRRDFLPAAWIHELSRLQDECPHEDLETLLPMVERELGVESISQIFEFIDPVPLGAASVGQVHRARLLPRQGQSVGDDVVIKIQYPLVEETFRVDIETIYLFCKLAQPEHLPLLDAVKKAFMSEFDFEREAVNLLLAGDDVKRTPYADSVCIPKPYPTLCGPHCLVMEYLPGKKLQDYLHETFLAMAKNQHISLPQLMQQYRHTPAPTTNQLRLFRAYAFLKDSSLNIMIWFYNTIIRPLSRAQPIAYSHTSIPLDIRQLIDVLYGVHGHQIVNGYCFNSDPHPGNIMWLDEKHFRDTPLGYTIGLIDYGQTASMTLWQRALWAEMMIALANNDHHRIAMLYFFVGHRTKHNWESTAVDLAVLGFDYDDDISRKGMNIEAYFRYLNDQDRLLVPFDAWAMPGRVTILLRGLAQRLHYPLKTHEVWAPICQQFLQTHPYLHNLVETSLANFEQIYTSQHAKAIEQAKLDFEGNDELIAQYCIDLAPCDGIFQWASHFGDLYHNTYANVVIPSAPSNIREYKPHQIPSNFVPQLTLQEAFPVVISQAVQNSPQIDGANVTIRDTPQFVQQIFDQINSSVNQQVIIE